MTKETNEGFFSSLPCLAIYFGNKKYNTIWKMPSVILSDYLASDLSGPEPWSEEAVMFTPLSDRQILLPDIANCRAVETLFKMCGVDFRIEERANAEFMSQGGKVPMVACGSFMLTDFERIVTFFKDKGHRIGEHLTEEKDRLDMRTFLSPIKILTLAELYICWANEVFYRTVTCRRYGSVYPFPLNHILPWRKRKEVLAELSVFHWDKKTFDDVFKEVQRCLKTFSDLLAENQYLFGSKPTEVDALLYGHLFAILTIDIPDPQLSEVVHGYPNLLKYYERIQREYFRAT